MEIQGRCHCGRVTYEAEIDPNDVGICHCNDCQQLTGSAYRVTASTPRAHFRITAGEPRCYVKTADNGQKRLQFFCGDCGSPIYTTGEAQAAEHVGIRVGTIDQRRELSPRFQIWQASRLPWVETINDLPGRPTD
ncbi:GFA family protein (plasmid) [Rhizobium sp. CB3171]|uniref:GFA family protein n=1 Tax=Rhizobium sp. CB3171 TaxID=3039157 RepID=UPI0024B25EF5|nr:GFA family protein [Rhizobium sp. CB3171]WFU06812.1 GFA family protein [Rhizobium sp. CB3171]